jgi:hypothetical protein
MLDRSGPWRIVRVLLSRGAFASAGKIENAGAYAMGILKGYHLRDRPTPSTIDICFVLRHGGYEVRLGCLPIVFIEPIEDRSFRIRTMLDSRQLSVEFVSLHAAFCAVEHLIQCGGSIEWLTWASEVK